MASVLEQQKNPTAIFGSQVDEQIAQATSRIRAHDLTFGALSLSALAVIYATTMILLDKYLNLQEWVRQLSLIVFVGALAVTGYWLIIRPLRNRINPLYAAAQVEKTIDDAKNSVTGYVDAQEKGEVHNAVKAAMSAKAAKAVGEADVNQAVDHRSLIVMGGIFVFFLLTLIVLFFVFRPTQFKSLVSRSFVPFSSEGIDTQTKLDLLKPDPPELTITNGQTITVAVHVGGKVPGRESPERVRVLIRHNQDDPDYEVIPMKEGETSRDWQVRIPEDMVLNGFWYKVAAGDAQTPEYRVNVRSLPLFTSFEATYEYPAYTRKPSDKAPSPDIRGITGTKVTLVARTNREVKDGSLKFELGSLGAVSGRAIPSQPDSLKFEFPLTEQMTEQTRYRLSMTSTNDEKSGDSPWYAITVEKDQAPTVNITKPEEPGTTAPANGQLAVDATVGDDFGIDRVRLCLRVGGQDLAPIPYMSGQSFRRAKDETWPRNLEYKDSVDLTKLKYRDGKPFESKEGTVIEYWVEAIDNCTLAKPVENWDKLVGNVGKSDGRRLTLSAPKSEEGKRELDQNKSDRKNDETKHNKAQQEKFNNENRDNQQQNNQQQNNQQQSGDEPKKNEAEKNSKNEAEKGSQQPGSDPMSKTTPNNANTQPSNPNDPQSTPPKNGNEPQKTQPGGMGQGGTQDPNTPPKSEPKGSDEPNTTKPKPKGGADEPKTDPKQGPTGTDAPKPMDGLNNGMDNNPKPMEQAPNPQSADAKKAEEEARRVQQELDKNKRPEGDAKSNSAANPEERTDPSQQKGQPKGGDNADAQPKEQQKNGPMNDPMGENKGTPSETKSEGTVEKSPDPSAPKPSPNETDPKNSKQKNAQPSEQRDEPLGGSPGADKPEGAQPKSEGKLPNESQMKQDPASGSQGKPATERKEEAGNSGDAGRDEKQNDSARNAGQAKPKSEPARGQDKKPANEGGASGDKSSTEESETGKAKPEKAPDSSSTKTRKQDSTGNKESGNGEQKPGPSDMNPNDATNGASETKPDNPMPKKGMGEKGSAEKEMEKGTEKPGGSDGVGEKSGQPTGGGQKNSSPTKGGGEDKLDPKKLEEMKDAAKDLNNPDPKKREDARNKLDNTVGKEGRQAIEDFQKKEQEKFDQLQKDLNSKDPATREAAEKNLEELAKQNQKNGGGGKELDQKQLQDAKEAAKDLNNPDPKKREEARNKLDNAVGKEGRQAIEDFQKKEQEKFDQLQKDLNSKDPATREAAEKKLEELAKQNQKNSGSGKELDQKQLQEAKEAAKDLNNPDPKKREEARNKLDNSIGKKGREALEESQKNQNTKEQMNQLLKDLDSSDKATRDAAGKKLDDMLKQSRKDEDEGKIDQKQLDELKEAAKDLNNPDPKKREEARKKLDDAVGKEGREALEDFQKKEQEKFDKLQKDLSSKDPAASEAAKKRLEEMMKRAREDASRDTNKLLPRIEDNPANRAKSAELQLEQFEKNRYNQELQERLGWTPEKYEEFLKAQQKRVEQLQKEAAAFEQQAQKPPMAPMGPTTINGSSGGKVEERKNTVNSNAAGSGAVYAPPGFADAAKKFAELTNKVPPPKP